MTTTPHYKERIGFSGHQSLSTTTREAVRAELMQTLSGPKEILAFTSLAAGSDQIFAQCVLASGNQLVAVVPCQDYELSFSDPTDLTRYRKLLRSAVDTIRLPYREPSEEAFWAAGKHIVDMTVTLIAVWDGEPAGGLGGTADVVEYARIHNKEVLRVWPQGASRD
jgi:hypothetical protein